MVYTLMYEGVKLWNELSQVGFILKSFAITLKNLKVLWPLLEVEHVAVLTVFYAYYFKCDYMYLCSLFMFI